jgi:SNF family Na+-dependent transporter
MKRSRAIWWGFTKMFLLSLVCLALGVALYILGEPMYTFTVLFLSAGLLICTLVMGLLVLLGFPPPSAWIKLAQDPEGGHRQERGRDTSDGS